MSNVSIQCEDAAHYLLKRLALAATTTSDVYPIERWTSVGLQINVANASLDLDVSIQILVSNDNVNFGNYGSPKVVTADDVITVNLPAIAFRHMKVSFTFTGGDADVEVLVNAKQA